MRIAILSMQKVINYGSVLQAFSLQKIIEKECGIKAVFININMKDKVPVMCHLTCDEDDYGKYEVPIKLIPRFIIHKLVNLKKEKEYVKKICDFQKDILKLNSADDNKEYDMVVIGSDEVFKCSDYVNLQLHGKVDNAKRVVTYAASCGQTNFSVLPENMEAVISAVSRIEYMSVRDEHTENYIKNFYSKTIFHHMDPVLIGELKHHKHYTLGLGNFLLVYAYSERIRKKCEIEEILKFAKKYGLKTISVGGKQYWCDIYLPLSPFEVLNCFNDAKYVVTDTFHGVVFSIINECSFAVIQRDSNLNKIGGLLKELGLIDRAIYKMDDMENILKRNINYKKVNSILDIERKKSIDYIKRCIKDNI